MELEQLTRSDCDVARRAGAYIAAARRKPHEAKLERTPAHD